MSINSSNTFWQNFKLFLENWWEPSEFALEIWNPNRHVSVSYVVAKITWHDTSKKPNRASFETRDMQIPHWEDIVYSSELRLLLQNIQKTTEILTRSKLVQSA